MQVTVNVVNEMKKLRDNTYETRYSWIPELIQNAQRAHATRMNVTIEPGTRITVTDNGCGCDNPNILFSKSESGWNQNIQKSEHPFGEGFFSTLMAANKITVSSIGFNAIFDAGKMFRENNPDCITITKNHKAKGFTTILEELCDNIHSYDVEMKFMEYGGYMTDLAIYVNGKKAPKKSRLPQDKNPYTRKVSSPYFNGWIQPFSFNRPHTEYKLHTYVNNRKCRDLDDIYDVSGNLNLTGEINLRAPERTDFIRDEKYDAMRKALDEDIKKMYISILSSGNNEDINEYASSARKHLEPEEYGKYLRLKVLSRASDPLPNDMTLKDSAEQYKDSDEEFLAALTGAPKTPVIKLDPIVQQDTSMVVTKSAAKRRATRRKRIEHPDESKASEFSFAFYVKENETDLYHDLIEQAQYYGITVVAVRNVLEEDYVINNNAFHHISEITDLVQLKAKFTGKRAKNSYEERAIRVMNSLVHQLYGFGHNCYIANTDCRKTIQTANGKDKTVEKIDALAMAYKGDIYIDRQHLEDCSYLTAAGDTDEITNVDRKFIMLNIEVISHELAHAVYGTTDNSKDHFETMTRITSDITKALFG